MLVATFITVVVVSETRVWRDAAEWGQGGGRLLLLPRQLSAGEHQLAGSSRPRLCFLRVCVPSLWMSRNPGQS